MKLILSLAVGDVDAYVEHVDIYFLKDSLCALIAAWLDISDIHFRDGVRLNHSARKSSVKRS